jgi:hypothetical protein
MAFGGRGHRGKPGVEAEERINMAYLTESRLRARAQRATRSLSKSATERLNEQVLAKAARFDIFLSHSIKDSDLVDGARLELEDKGYTV